MVRANNQHQRLTAILEPVVKIGADRIAGALLERFGTIKSVLQASSQELRGLAGSSANWADALIAGRELYAEALYEDIERSKVDPNDRVLREYLIARLGTRKQELMIALLADERRGFISEETLATGDEASVRFTARTLFARLLALDARCFILAHNHPNGGEAPSLEDVSSTRAIAQQAAVLGIQLLDHFVISGSRLSSMKGQGLL